MDKMGSNTFLLVLFGFFAFANGQGSKFSIPHVKEVHELKICLKTSKYGDGKGIFTKNIYNESLVL